MLTAMIDGETDPLRLADMAKGKMRRKIPDLAQALTGHFDANHARLARSMLPAEFGRAVHGGAGRGHCRGLPAVGASDRAAADHSRCGGEGGAGDHRRDRRRHVAVSDRGPVGRLGGFGTGDARVRRQAEPGWETTRQQMVGRLLVGAAGSVGRMHGKNYLAVQHARLMRRRGMGRAQVAVGHSILVSAYWMLRRDEPYHDLGTDWHSRRNDEAHTRRLVAQLERLGHTVIINPAA
jgi:transposase